MADAGSDAEMHILSRMSFPPLPPLQPLLRAWILHGRVTGLDSPRTSYRSPVWEAQVWCEILDPGFGLGRGKRSVTVTHFISADSCSQLL